MEFDDAALLGACPDYVSVGSLLKAHPREDGGRRFVYFEASKEALDQQDETVLAKALAESSDFYLRYGNVDIDHYTQIGAKLGIPDYPLYEIGQPVEVGQRDGSTFVKSEFYRLVPGKDPRAVEKADQVWAGLTASKPPQRWYPSVGGSVLQKSIIEATVDAPRRAVISKVRWANVGLSKTPVNQHVGTCEVVPVGTFAKCLAAGGVIELSKTLTAGYGTDSAGLDGGASLREQSLDHGIKNYWDFRERFSKKLSAARAGGANPKAADLVRIATTQFGLPQGEAAEYVERFVADLKSGLQQRNAA